MAFLDDLLKNAQKAAGNVGSFVNTNVVHPLQQDVSKAYNTVQAPVTGAVGLATIGADQLFNNGKNKQALTKATKQALNKNVAQSFVPQNVANGTASPLQFGQSFTKTGVQLAPYFLGAGGGALTAKLGSQVADRLGGSLAARTAGQAAHIGSNAAIATPTFAGLNAVQQGVDSGFTKFDPRQATLSGLQAGAMSAAGDLAPIVARGALKGTKIAAQKTGQAIDDAAAASHDKLVNSAASSAGERINPHQSLFEPTLAKVASVQDIKGAKQYYNQLKQGKDIGPIATTTNASGAIEPLTKDGLQKYLAYKAAYHSIDRNTPQTNDYGGSNFTNNPYKNIPTNHIDSTTLETALANHEMRTQGGYIGGPLALQFGKAKEEGRVFTDPNNAQRFEATDKEARLTSQGSSSGLLGDLLQHPTLYTNYPQLADTKVNIKIDKNRVGSANGTYTNNASGSSISIFAKNHAEAKKELLHEIQHNIQEVEGVQQGTTPRAAGSLENYKNNYAEAEARAVAERRNLTDEERQSAQFNNSLDVPKEKLVTGGAKGEAINSVNPTGSIFADYTPEARAKAPLGPNMTTLDKTIGGKPNDTVTIYRGTSGSDQIVPGDFITTNKQLAQDYAGSGKVISQTVKKGDIIDDITEPGGEEYLYRPNQPKSTLAMSTNTNQLPYGTESVQNSLTKGAKEGRQNISEPVAQAVQGEHVVRNTEALNQRGIQAADSLKSSDLYQEANNRMQVKQGTISDEDVSFINQAIERADKEGNHQEATNLHNQLSEHLVANGQTSQAAILLYNRSPQGLLNKAVKDINNGTEKGHVTPELRKELQDLADNIKNAPNQDTKELAVAKLAQRVQKEIPNGKLQGALSVWKAGLLSGLKTHTGNMLSNATFAGLKKISDIPATAADAAIGAFTGKRTKVFTTEGLTTGFGQGLKRGAETLTTGIDRRNIINGKYEGHGELHFKNKAANIAVAKPTNFVFRALGASDQPFYYAAYKNSLFEQAQVAAKNAKVKGKEKSSFIEQFAKQPPKEALQLAENDAKKAVLGEDNRVADALSSFTQKVKPAQAVIPFTKVPTNFLSQALDYTPVGPIKEAVRQITIKKGFDQRGLAEAIGKGATGTGLIYLGAQLANNNLLSGQYPSDPKEQARWKAEGITPNSVKLGGQWLSLNYLGPVGILFQAGKDFTDATKRGDDAAISAIAGVGKSLTGQSFLTGFSSLANALNDPQRFGANFINSQAGSVVPAAINDVANATDPLQRQTNNLLQTVQSRVPGARERLNQKQDVYGNGLTQRTDPFNLTVNPLRNSDQVDSSTLAEVRRLHDADPNNSDLQVTPTPVGKSIKVNGTDVKLTDQQRYDLQNQIGQTTQNNWSQLIQTPEYKALSDVQKAAALNKLRTDSTALAQTNFVQTNNLAVSDSKLTNSQKDLASGNPLSSYTKQTATKGTGTTSKITINPSLDSSSKSTLQRYSSMSAADRLNSFAKDPKAQYQYDQAVYNNKKANGSLSLAQDLAAQSKLQKESIGSKYSQDTRSLYGLSKTQLLSGVQSGAISKDQLNQVIAYGDDLANSGLTSQNKFRSSTGAVSLTTKKSTTRGSGVTAARKLVSSGSQSKTISSTVKLAKIAKSAKLSSSKSSFTSKVRKTGMKAYSKGNTQKVKVKTV